MKKLIEFAETTLVGSFLVVVPLGAVAQNPTEVTSHAILHDGRLVDFSEGDVAPERAELLNHTWKWRESRYSNDTMKVPPNPEQYTLQFQPDGTIHIRADCNRGGGSYTIKDTRLSVEVTHTTMAMCPPGSLDGDFIRDVTAAAIYFLKDGDLLIDLKFDSGTMRFSRE